ncbi:MAG: PEP-CTERM sorting domain-containing protein, partial [Caldimonas sp.]
GRDGGNGQVTVSNGGRWTLSDGGGDSRPGDSSIGINIGRDANSSGKLTITGPGSSVEITSSSLNPAAGVADNFNPYVSVGRFSGASGELVVENGGKLLMQGNAISTVANSRGTTLHIGGASDTELGGIGTARVSGLGSEIRLGGSDAFIAVGQGLGAIGQLTVNDQAIVRSTGMNVGRAGGVGTLLLDNGTLEFTGQFTGSNVSGAFLTIGNRGGTGVANIGNGSHVNLTNLGSAGATLYLGGTGPNPLGNGTMTLSGASQINLTAASGLATFVVGHDGTGFATVKEGSSINVGDGSTFIGRLAGSTGTLVMQSGSSLNSGYVGVGRTPAGDGGTGTLILSNSTLTATTIEIGTAGFLGGNNGVINGNVILHGVLSPGESPGRIIVNGGLRTGSGHLILDVASNGDNGFDIDHLILTKGSTFSFTGLEVTFNFLAGADPGAFAAAGGLDLDNFLQSLDPATGAITGLSSEFTEGETWSSLFATATFDAVSDAQVLTDFVVSANGDVSFNVAAVPEPETWALMLFGLGALAGRARRRARAAARN